MGSTWLFWWMSLPKDGIAVICSAHGAVIWAGNRRKSRISVEFQATLDGMPRPRIKINIPISMLFKSFSSFYYQFFCWLKKVVKRHPADGIPFCCGSVLHASSSLSYVLELCQERFTSHKDETSKAMIFYYLFRRGWQEQPCRALWQVMEPLTRVTPAFRSFTPDHTSDTDCYSWWSTPSTHYMMVSDYLILYCEFLVKWLLLVLLQ